MVCLKKHAMRMPLSLRNISTFLFYCYCAIMGAKNTTQILIMPSIIWRNNNIIISVETLRNDKVVRIS